MLGSKTHLLSGDNVANAPYFMFGNSMKNGSKPTSDTSHNFIYMSSSLFNEGYGNSFSQAELPYTPGPYEGFATGQEPENTKIGKPYSTLVIEEGDEIRFGNNENFTFIINSVEPPQSNLHPDDVGYLKLELNKPVPASINKDFFLIRRYLPNAGSVFIDLPYPYTNETLDLGEQISETRNGKLVKAEDSLLKSISKQPQPDIIDPYPAANNITGSFINVSLTGGTGTGAKATIITSGSAVSGFYPISFIQVTDAGSGYLDGDLLGIGNTQIDPDEMAEITLNPLDIQRTVTKVQQNISKPFSSDGILFPSYPIPELETSASIIVNDLISKGIIQS